MQLFHKKSTRVFAKICFDVVKVYEMNLGWDVDPKVDCVLPRVCSLSDNKVSLGNTRTRTRGQQIQPFNVRLPLTSLAAASIARNLDSGLG
jgi:hypothetical protein